MQKLTSWRENQDARIHSIIICVGGPIFEYLVPNPNVDLLKGTFKCLYRHVRSFDSASMLLIPVYHRSSQFTHGESVRDLWHPVLGE